jgi:N-acetylmuramoyl-L-alanine amidase
MKGVCLDPGHGGKFTGAVFGGIAEKDIVLDICRVAKSLLVAKGVRVTMTRDGDYALADDLRTDLLERCRIANKAKCDIFVSVHTNADPDKDEPGMPEARGEEIWIYPGSVKGRRLAEWLSDYVDVLLPNEPFRGIKEGNLAVLKYTKMPADLVECGFIDNNTTNRKLADSSVRRRFGEILAMGILGYLQSGEK